MLRALVNGVLSIPQKGLKGNCQFCGDVMISKCGELKMHHWAHMIKECDEWQIGKETEWHFNWKKTIGLDFAEKRISKDELFHISDILIPNIEGSIDLIIEFQNSPLSPIEVHERESFYGDRLIWILNGTELKEKFVINRNSDSKIFKKWLYDPELDYYLADDYSGKTERGYVIRIPKYSYNKDYETFLFNEGYKKNTDSYKVVEMRRYLGLKDKGNASSLYYYKSISDHSYDTLLEYRHEFMKRRNSLTSKMIELNEKKMSDKDVIKEVSYQWKYARTSFNVSKRPLYIDLNDTHIFQLENGNVAEGNKGNLIKKNHFIARIKERTKNIPQSLEI
jgi:hypothetical protein